MAGVVHPPILPVTWGGASEAGTQTGPAHLLESGKAPRLSGRTRPAALQTLARGLKVLLSLQLNL